MSPLLPPIFDPDIYKFLPTETALPSATGIARNPDVTVMLGNTVIAVGEVVRWDHANIKRELAKCVEYWAAGIKVYWEVIPPCG